MAEGGENVVRIKMGGRNLPNLEEGIDDMVEEWSARREKEVDRSVNWKALEENKTNRIEQEMEGIQEKVKKLNVAEGVANFERDGGGSHHDRNVSEERMKRRKLREMERLWIKEEKRWKRFLWEKKEYEREQRWRAFEEEQCRVREQKQNEVELNWKRMKKQMEDKERKEKEVLKKQEEIERSMWEADLREREQRVSQLEAQLESESLLTTERDKEDH